jgi:hypothetical protein
MFHDHTQEPYLFLSLPWQCYLKSNMIITKLLIAFTNPAITSTSAIVHAEDVVHVHMILPSN